jgi:hypothetical protein
MSFSINMEIEVTDTVVKQCTQALGSDSFIDIEWVRLNNVPTHPLTNLILVYNIISTANEAGMITEIANLILYHNSHSEYIQFAVTHLGKQSIILGYNWLCNHNLEINWQTKEVKMSHCPQ